MGPFGPYRRFTDQSLDRWLDAQPGAVTAYQGDAMYRAQMAWWRQMLTTVELSMEDQGIGPEVREKVINTAVYGSPDVGPALERMRQAQEHLRQQASLLDLGRSLRGPKE